MATLLQIQANRLNAQKSTGPRTVEGQSVSRFNALKTGIDAHSDTIPGEDPAVLEALILEYYGYFQPTSPAERFQVDIMIATDWQLRRLHRLEAQIWEDAMRDWRPEDDIVSSGPPLIHREDCLTRLHRPIDSAGRNHYCAPPENATPRPTGRAGRHRRTHSPLRP